MADNKRDYYEILGISKDSSDSEIKKAFRKQAKKYHPDANPNNKEAETKFKEVNEAYEVLSDAKKKAQYDRFGHSGFPGSGGAHTYSGAGFDMGDIFESFFSGGFSDIFTQSGSERRRSGARRGADVHSNLNISFEESFFGVTKTITVPMNETCETCSGSGAKPGTYAETCKNCGGSGQERFLQQTMFGTMTSVRTCHTCRGEGKIIKEPCSKCAGRGLVKRSKTLEINIPKGIDNNQSIRLSGRGEPGEKGGEHGDLLVTIYVASHKNFRRKDMSIYLDIPVSFTQLALGAEIDIPTMTGIEKHNIKPGTQTGTVVTLKSKGFPSVRNNKIFGDMFVSLNVTIPTKLTEKQQELLRQFSGETETEEQKKASFFSKIKEKFE